MIQKIQLHAIKHLNKRTTFVFILCSMCYLSSHAQKMKKLLNKELIAKVDTVYEETPDDNPCAGSQIYLTLLFDKEQVQITEKEISTCGKVATHKIGIYYWKMLPDQKIEVDFIKSQTEDTYAKNLALELRDKQLIGSVTHVNGRIMEYIFKEKEQ